MARPTPQQLKSHPARHASSTIANSMPDYDGADISVEPAAFGDTAPRSAGATASAEDIPRGVGARPLAGGGLGEALGAVMGGDEQLLAQIARLKSEQAVLRDNKKKVAKDLKNAEKRRGRLKKKARQLSDADLVAVLHMRHDNSGASAAAPGTASSSTTAAAPGSASSSASAS